MAAYGRNYWTLVTQSLAEPKVWVGLRPNLYHKNPHKISYCSDVFMCGLAKVVEFTESCFWDF